MALWRMRASAGAGGGSSTSSRRNTSGPPFAWIRMAFMIVPRACGLGLLPRIAQRHRAIEHLQQLLAVAPVRHEVAVALELEALSGRGFAQRRLHVSGDRFDRIGIQILEK